MLAIWVFKLLCNQAVHRLQVNLIAWIIFLFFWGSSVYVRVILGIFSAQFIFFFNLKIETLYLI